MAVVNLRFFFNKITEILCVPLLVERCVWMRVYKHGCDVLDSRVFLRNINYFCKINRKAIKHGGGYVASSKHEGGGGGGGRILDNYANPRLRLGFASRASEPSSCSEETMLRWKTCSVT